MVFTHDKEIHCRIKYTQPSVFLIFLDNKATFLYFLYTLFNKDFLFMHLTSEHGQLAMKKIVIKAAT